MSVVQSRTRVDVQPGRLFIGGRWEAAAGDAKRDLIDPASGAIAVSVAEADAVDVERAVGAARAAFDEGPWPRMTVRERGRVLLRAAELLRQRASEFAELESFNVGKPIALTRRVDLPISIETFEYYGQLATALDGAVRGTQANLLAYTRREPLGVVAAITPFNFPLVLSSKKIAPALLAGNTVVHKPAVETPLTALRLAEVLQEAGLPDGAYNVVTGDARAGQALVRDPRVAKIAFTGSTSVGKRIVEQCAQNLPRVTLELGGKSANIIFADADLGGAVATAIRGFTFNTGQFCMAGTRLLVQRPVYEEVVRRLVEALADIKVGDPFSLDTAVGPMAGEIHKIKVDTLLDRARREGVDIYQVPCPEEDGFYVAPAVLFGVAQDSPYVQEEIFGPVLTVQMFDSEDEAVEMANGTPYGLAAGVQTRDIARAHTVAARLEAGTVWVNTWAAMDITMPIGGYKQSGYGRENGPEGLEEYLQVKSVLVSLS